MSRRLSSLLPLCPLALLLTACSFGLDFDDIQACGDNEQLAADECVCAPTYERNELGACVCPANSAPGTDGLCACEAPRVRDDATGDCVCGPTWIENELGACVCPEHGAPGPEGLCVCEAPRVFDAASSACACGPTWRTNPAGECVCPAGTVEQNGSCECPPDAPRDPATGDCVCRIEDGLVWDAASGSCRCERADQVVVADNTCGCPAPLVESQPGSTESRCVCPVELGTEGGSFALRVDSPTCTNELVRGGFLGRPDRTPVDLTVIETPEGERIAALLEQDAANAFVTLYSLTAATSDGAAVEVVELAAARASLVNQTLVGVALTVVDELPIPIVLPFEGPPFWMDMEAESLRPTVLADGSSWPELMYNYGGTGWWAESEARGFLLFNGVQRNLAGDIEWVASSLSAAGPPEADGSLRVEVSTLQLDAPPFLADQPDGSYLLTLLIFDRPVPILNSDGVFVIGGHELTEPVLCPEPCPHASTGRPIAFELTLDASAGALTLARRAEDFIDHGELNTLLATMWGEARANGGPADFFFQIGGIAGTGNEVRGLAIPSFIGCELDGTWQRWPSCTQLCVDNRCTLDGQACVDELDCPSYTDAHPVYEPAAILNFSRTPQIFATSGATLLSEFADAPPEEGWANKRVEAIDPTVLGADATRRLFVLTRQPLSQLGQVAHELVLVELAEDAFTPLAIYPFDAPATFLAESGPRLFSAGPFVFVQTNQGMRVLQLRALSAPVP